MSEIMREPTSPGGDLPESLLSALLDGELTAPEAAAVRARLEVSPEWREILEEVRVARDLVRDLPPREPPTANVLDLDAARRRRRGRWVAAAGAVAAMVAVGAVAFVPGPDRVRPPVATFTDAHAARSSMGNDAISTLAGAAVPEGQGR